jgi:hypothetical protein
MTVFTLCHYIASSLGREGREREKKKGDREEEKEGVLLVYSCSYSGRSSIGLGPVMV